MQERKVGGQFPSRGARIARVSRGDERFAEISSRWGAENGRRGGGRMADVKSGRRERRWRRGVGESAVLPISLSRREVYLISSSDTSC